VKNIAHPSHHRGIVRSRHSEVGAYDAQSHDTRESVHDVDSSLWARRINHRAGRFRYELSNVLKIVSTDSF
jgi:hypothetical protein